jgi:hypothetical protein
MNSYEIGSKLNRAYLVLLSSLLITVAFGSGCVSKETPTATVASDEHTNTSITPTLPTDSNDTLTGPPL